MNRSLTLFLSTAVGLSALVAACASENPANTSGPNGTEPPGQRGEEGSSEEEDDGSTTAMKDAAAKDASTTQKDAGAPPKDAGSTAFSKQEIQALFNARCTPCHIGGTSGGMSLGTDFTTATVGVASTELPSMKRIAPGDKEASYLFHKLRGTHLDVGGSGLRMPRNGPPYLADSDIARIGAFIDGL